MAAALPDLLHERNDREEELEWTEVVDGLVAAANSIPEGAPVGTKIEPTSVQRFLMAEAAADSDASGWSDDPEDWLPIVDAQIAAANRVDDIPVGTIARRPDGGWVAVRLIGPNNDEHWSYRALERVDKTDLWPKPNDADSWPVIFTPGEAVGSGPTTYGGETYDPREGEAPQAEPCRSIDPVSELKCSQTLGHEGNHGTCSGLEWSDPTAQQEPAYTVAAAFEEMAKYWDNCIVTTTKREPRVVDRLGVDEQGSRWLDVFGWVWSFENGWWKTENGGLGYGCVDPYIRGPFKEILEPRVLPSLDCEEARDGTVWEAQNGWRFWFNGEWRTDNGTRGKVIELYALRLLRSRSPYIEVLPDVG